MPLGDADPDPTVDSRGEMQVGSGTSRSDVEVPDSISSDMWAEIVGEDPVSSNNVATSTPVSGESETSPMAAANADADRLAKLEGVVQQLTGWASAQPRNGQGDGKDNATPNSNGFDVDKVVAELPISDEQGSNFTSEDAKFMVETIAKVVDAKQMPALGAIQKKLEVLDGSITHQGNQNLVQEFDENLDSLLDDAGVGSAFDRKAFRAEVINRGTQRHKGQFDQKHVPELFREINAERLAEDVQARQSYVTNKQRDEAETPATQLGTGNAGSVAQSIRKSLRDPNDRDFDFRGEKMTQLATAFLNGSQ